MSKAKKDKGTYLKESPNRNETIMLCNGCGVEQAIRCPLPVDQFCDIVEGFQRRHEACKK